MNILPLNMIKIFFKEIITFIPFVLILHKFLQNDSYKMNNLNSGSEKNEVKLVCFNMWTATFSRWVSLEM